MQPRNLCLTTSGKLQRAVSLPRWRLGRCPSSPAPIRLRAVGLLALEDYQAGGERLGESDSVLLVHRPASRDRLRDRRFDSRRVRGSTS